MMKQGLTKREKLLLLVLGLLALIYLAFQFGFRPLYESYSNSRLERDRLQAERLELEMKILNLQTLIDENKIANDDYIRITEDYPEVVPNEEVDTVLTNLVLGVGMSIRSVRFFTPPSDANAILFTIVGATMTTEGSYTSLMTLLDEVEKIPNISIVSMSFSERRGSSNDQEGFVRGQGSMTLGFELMYITPQD